MADPFEMVVRHLSAMVDHHLHGSANHEWVLVVREKSTGRMLSEGNVEDEDARGIIGSAKIGMMLRTSRGN